MRGFFILLAFILVIFSFGCSQDESSGEPQEKSINLASQNIIGDASTGKRLYIYCQACHTLKSGGAHKVGPNLFGFINSAAAEKDGFVFSEALIQSELVWTDDVLDQWMISPSKLVPGNNMVFAGINDPQQRADLIAYLNEATKE
ncbi:MAG: cytochrome c family protein [Pseudomonadota bacterium]|nr:cytochrome c family protein [Pseudomonadota bacterium]